MNYWVKQLSTLKQKTSAQPHQDKSDMRQEWAKCKQCFCVQKPEGFVVPLKSPNPLQTGAASPSSRCARMPFICVSAAEQWHRGGVGGFDFCFHDVIICHLSDDCVLMLPRRPHQCHVCHSRDISSGSHTDLSMWWLLKGENGDLCFMWGNMHTVAACNTME